jgi:TonB family protein
MLAGCVSAKPTGPIGRVEDLDKPPHVVFQPAPDYTEAWTRSRLPAQAVVMLTIEEDGSVSDVVLETSTKPEFGAPAVDAVKKYRFDPVTSHGKPARVRLQIKVDGEASLKYRDK